MRDFWQFKNTADDKAELYIYGEIVSSKICLDWLDEDSVCYRAFLDELKAKDNKEIDVYINSGGGDVFAANAIYSELKKNKAKINIIIEGICASAATIIAMAGDTIKAGKNSLIMIHNPTISLNGNFSEEELEKKKGSVNAVKKSIIAAYKTRIKKSDEELSDLMDSETWYTGEEALEAGIIDEVIEDSSEYVNMANGNIAIINNMVCDLQKFNNFPSDKIKTFFRESFFNTKNQNKEADEKMDKDKVINEAVQEAVSKERERLKAIDAIAANLPDDMVFKAKYVENLTAEALAFKALKENSVKAAESFKDIVADNMESGVNNVQAQAADLAEENASKNKAQRLAGFLNKVGGIK